jgi:hypothetical protein
MSTLTETIIDIADRHTTLHYLGDRPPAVKPLPLGTAEDYCALHRRLARPPRTEYADITAGRTAAVLGRLSPGYADYKYWHRYLGTSVIQTYPEDAWQRFLPFDAGVTTRIAYVPDPGLNVRVSPIPRVLLYPYGWSTWISLRILGEHTVADLAAFLKRLFTAGAFRYQTGAPAFPLGTLFGDVAAGVRVDAFAGDKTREVDAGSYAVVATVMAKHGGSPALGALSVAEQTQLLTIARPYGPPPKDPFAQRVYRLQPGSDLEYIVYDKHGRFLWVEHLLEPIGRNYEHLRCYHNNSFTSLVHAWHLQGLLEAAAQQTPLTRTVFDLVQAARAALEGPRYKCASLVQYLQEPELKSAMTKAAALQAPADKPVRGRRRR